jgi:hypothetical protein
MVPNVCLHLTTGTFHVSALLVIQEDFVMKMSMSVWFQHHVEMVLLVRIPMVPTIVFVLRAMKELIVILTPMTVHHVSRNVDF